MAYGHGEAAARRNRAKERHRQGCGCCGWLEAIRLQRGCGIGRRRRVRLGLYGAGLLGAHGSDAGRGEHGLCWRRRWSPVRRRLEEEDGLLTRRPHLSSGERRRGHGDWLGRLLCWATRRKLREGVGLLGRRPKGAGPVGSENQQQAGPKSRPAGPK